MSTNRIAVGIVASVLACGAPYTECRAETQSQSSYRVIRGVREPLRIDPAGRMIVRLGDQGDDSPSVQGLRASVDQVGLKTFRMGDGLWVRLRAGAAGEQLAGSGTYRTPLLIGANGMWMAPTPDLFVRFDEGASDDFVQRVLAGVPGAVSIDRDYASIPGMFRVRTSLTDGLSALAVANQLAESRGVEWAEPNWLFEGRSAGSDPCDSEDGWVETPPTDPLYEDAWALNNTGQTVDCPTSFETISFYCPGEVEVDVETAVADVDLDAPEAWNITLGDQDVLVLVIEQAAYYSTTHADINHLQGADFTSMTPAFVSSVPGPIGTSSHVGAVASAITALMDGSGTVGIAPGCRVITADVYDSANSVDAVIRALGWASERGVRVSNTSLYLNDSMALEAQYAETYSNGMIHFASSGNLRWLFYDSGEGMSHPAAFDDVIAVGAIQPDGSHACFSQFRADGCPSSVCSGQDVEFAAPGVCIHGFAVGTSFASPYTAGVAALVLSRNPSLTPDDVREILHESADPTVGPSSGVDEQTGYGLPRACAALTHEDAAPAPDRFDRIEPADKDHVVQFVPRLCWEAAAALDGTPTDVTYIVEISSDGLEVDPTIIHTSTEQTAVSYRVPSSVLSNDTTYYWRVKAIDGAEDAWRYSNRVGPSYWSTWTEFKVRVCFGDADHDGDVDGDDSAAVVHMDNWLTEGPLGDANGDGVVNFGDMTSVLENWDDTCYPAPVGWEDSACDP